MTIRTRVVGDVHAQGAPVLVPKVFMHKVFMHKVLVPQSSQVAPKQSSQVVGEH